MGQVQWGSKNISVSETKRKSADSAKKRGEKPRDNSPGDTLLSQAVDIVAGQLASLRELGEQSRHVLEEATTERRNVFMALEEVDYRTRFLEKNLKAEKISDPEIVAQRRATLMSRQEMLEQRKAELNDLQADMEDAHKRLSLLIRQLEIAGVQLTRSEHPSVLMHAGANPWEIALRAQLIEGQEDERSRLAREIHDGPAQVLANAIMRVRFCNQILKRDDKVKAQGELESLIDLISESLLDVRRFMFNLKPQSLSQHGLVNTLREYTSDFSNQYNLEITVDLPQMNGVLSTEQELTIFRIVQESLQNIRKHASANLVQIYGGKDSENRLTITIKDDGRGFVPHTAELSTMTRGAGLPGMRERAELAGGKLHIKSASGQGTEVSLTISLNN